MDVGTATTDHTATVTALNSITSVRLTSGVDTNQANRCMARLSRQIAPGATDDIDLYDWAGVDLGAGLGLDPLGQPAVLEEVVCFIVRHSSGDGRLEILGSIPTHHVGWCPCLTVANGGALREGGAVCLFQPDTDALDIQDDVSHLIRFGAVGGFVNYDIFALGRHDDDASSSSSTSTLSSSCSSLSSLSSPSTSMSCSSRSSRSSASSSS